MVKQRNEIDEKYQWDLSTIFATDQAWEEEAASLAADIKAASHSCVLVIFHMGIDVDLF